MATEKRERQRHNRSLRIAAAEAAAKKAATARRVKIFGTLAVAVAVLLGVLAFLQRDSGDTADVDYTANVGDAPNISVTPTAQPSSDDDASQEDEDSEISIEVGGDSETVVPPADATSSRCPSSDGSDKAERVTQFDQRQPDCIDPEATYVAVFDTSEGEMRFSLRADEVPATVNNFVTLARWGYYDGTTLFRTDPSIAIIQGGSPHTNSPSDPGPGYTIQDEPEFEEDPDTGELRGPYRYEPGQLVMARSAGRDSASAQFFVTTGPEASLLDSQGTYVVFGTTDEAGLAVAQSVMSLHEDTGTLGGAPSREVTVHSVDIEETPPNG